MPIRIDPKLDHEKLSEASDKLKSWEIEYISKLPLDSKTSYLWGKALPNFRDQLKSKITSDKYALMWGRTIGRDEEIRNTLRQDTYIFKWAKEFPEDRDYLRTKISTDHWRFEWVKEFERDRGYMKAKFRGRDQDALKWAANIGDVMDMREHVENRYWKRTWNGHFSDHEDFENIGFHDIDPKFHSIRSTDKKYNLE